MTMGDDQSKTCLVLGGRSFIGRCLVVRLLKLGNWIVRVADSAHSLQLDPSESKSDSPLSRALSTGRASYAHVDIRNKTTVIHAVKGSEVVFYLDDTDSCIHDFYFGYSIIVQGAKNVINACQQCKVKRLIYNSIADVVFDSSHDIRGGNETLLHSSKFKNVYCEHKAQAEALVLLANDIDGLLTCAIRPSNVFGPGDKHLLPSLIDVAKSGWAKFIIGSDKTVSDFTYVENVAHALICAEVALCSHMVIVSGKVFFITNFEPARSWQFALCMLEGLGYYRPMIKLPAMVVQLIVFLIKWMLSKMNSRDLKHISVHNIIQLMSHTTTYNCSAAEQDIGYSPIISLDDGITLTVKSFSHLAKDTRLGDEIEQSKMEEMLGSGVVADILLWRDEKKSFLCFLGVAFLYYWFCLCERPIISSTAMLLMLIIVVLCGYARLSSKAYGDARLSPKVSISSMSGTLPCFEISETYMRSGVRTIANIWNGVVHVARSLAQGDDWSLFFKGMPRKKKEIWHMDSGCSRHMTGNRACLQNFKPYEGGFVAFGGNSKGGKIIGRGMVVASIYLFKLLVVNFFPTSIGLGFTFSFIFFLVYEQCEEDIDGIIGILFEIMRKSVITVTCRLPISKASPLCNTTNKPTKPRIR